MRTIYAAMQNADLTEGRGPMVPRGFFRYKSDAETFASTLQGVQGIGCGDVAEYTLYDTVAEHPDFKRKSLIESALAKLTPAERSALGV